MSQKPVTMVVTFQARPGKETELRSLLTGLLGPTRREAGCINYDLHGDPDDPAKFLFYENWASHEHINAHGETPHIQTLLQRMDELCVEPLKISYWEKIG